MGTFVFVIASCGPTKNKQSVIMEKKTEKRSCLSSFYQIVRKYE
jgi:hypothetical protein